MFCPNCGAAVEGRFCGGCGANVALAGSPISNPPAAEATAGGLAENVAGALCYGLGILTGILFLVLEPYSRNPRIRFHAFQSIFFSVAVLAIWFAGLLFSVMLSFPLSLAMFMI